MMNRNVLIGLLLLIAGIATSQEKEQYVHFDLGGGLHKINYTLENGVTTPGTGLATNIGYTVFINPNWGLGTGVGIQSFKSTATMNYLCSTPSIDADGDSYEYQVYYTDWQETQKIWMIDMPVSLNYKRQFGEKLGMWVSVGTKIAYPIKSTYQTVEGNITTIGYYPQWNVELSNMPQHNFSTLEGFPDSKITSNMNVSAFADLGFLYKITNMLDLYLGAYTNYGFSDVSNTANQDIYVEEGVYNGLLASNQLSKANLVSVGLKAGICVRLSKKKDGDIAHQQKIENELYEAPVLAISEPIDLIPEEADNTQIKEQPEEPLVKTKQIDLKLSVVDSKTGKPLKAKIALHENGQVIKTFDSNKNEITQLTVSDDKEYAIKIDAKGYLYQYDVLDFDALEEKMAKGFELNPIVRKETNIELRPLTFESGLGNISDEDVETLNILIRTLKENPDLKIEIAGHADNTGNDNINMPLSVKRSQTVVDYLVSHGANAEQLIPKGYGSSQPIADNSTAEGRSKNRRVEFKIMK